MRQIANWETPRDERDLKRSWASERPVPVVSSPPWIQIATIWRIIEAAEMSEPPAPKGG
jgi:hypothetical protein